MNAHTPFDANQDWSNPYCQNRSNDPMVDALLGNAYHVVRTVYCNLGNLKLIYDFLNKYGMVLGVKSETELKAMPTSASYVRLYGFDNTNKRVVTDYLYVDGDRTGVIPDDPSATGSWILVATSNSDSGGDADGKASPPYIPYSYNNGSAIGGETTIPVPVGTVGVPMIVIEGYTNLVGYGFTYDASTLTVTLAQPLEPGDEVHLFLTGTPAVPDNPNVTDWVQINWLYNGGYASGGEQVIAIPYTFESVPAIYKNGERYYAGLADKSYTVDAANQRILLTEPLATNDRLIVTIGGESTTLTMSDRTVQEVARSANVKDSEVILSTNTTQYLNGMKVIYDVVAQKIYGLPALPTNVYISSVSDGNLTYSPGNITVSLLPAPTSEEVLRKDLSQNTGASMVKTSSGETLQSALNSLHGLELTEGDALIPVVQPYPNAVVTTVHEKMDEIKTVADWGAVSGVESSSAAQKMVDDTGTLIVPAGFNLVAKNINISSADKVFIYGKMTLPSGCVDFDRALYAYSNTRGLQVYINELDGNKAGQSGANVGTHLLYLIQCQKVNVYVKYAHSNYFSRTYTPVLSPDGFRTESAGALFFHECHYSQFIADRIENWGREGIMANKTNYSVMALGLALGDPSSNGHEYSGFQFSGDYNNLLYANVENSGASGGSFDCRYSHAGTIKVIRNKYFGSVGLGHPDSPAEYNVIDCIISINSAANGFQFAANSNNNRVLSATVINPAAVGINQSDGANNNSVDNFIVKDPGSSHVTAFNSTLTLTNGDLTSNANNKTRLNAVGTGRFIIRNVRLDPEIPLQMRGFNGLAGNSTANIVDANMNVWSHIILVPANANGALANAYVSAVNNGSCTIATASGSPAGSGASFRYMVV